MHFNAQYCALKRISFATVGQTLPFFFTGAALAYFHLGNMKGQQFMEAPEWGRPRQGQVNDQMGDVTDAQSLEVSVWPRIVAVWTAFPVVQVNGVLLHSLPSIGFNSQSGGRQSWWQGFVLLLQMWRHALQYATTTSFLPKRRLSNQLTLWNLRSRETSSKTLANCKGAYSPSWLLMTHWNVVSKLPIPESRDLDLGKNVVCRPISLFF